MKNEVLVHSAAWRKSSYSLPDNDCVEVADGLFDVVPVSENRWFTSSYSGAQNECIEVAAGPSGVVPVRDSKVPSGPVLVVPVSAWRAFVDQL